MRLRVKVKEKKENKNDITELVFIIDRSGSMQGMERDTIGGFNSVIEEQKKKNGSCFVTTVLFDNEIKKLHDRVEISKLKPMTQEDYTVGGCTALLDAFGSEMQNIASIHKYARKSDVPADTLFVIITDGLENASRQYTAEQVKGMVEKHSKKDKWEFIFLGANIDSVETAGRYGIAPSMANDYYCDSEGTQNVYCAVNEAINQLRSGCGITEEWSIALKADNERRER